jgi:HK97 family phage portal protein
MKPAGWVHDTIKVGDGSGNSIVVAALSVIASGLAEPPLQLMERDSDNAEAKVFDHAITTLWSKPNEHMTDDLSIMYLTWAMHLEGNAYFFKTRDDEGNVIELWPLMPELVEAVSINGAFLSYWLYTVNGQETRINPEDMLHLRLGIDPTNYRLGLAPLKSVLREILGDEEAGQFTTSLLKNMGVPGVILSPDEPGDPGPSKDQADSIKDEYMQKFGGERRGEPLVLTGRMKVEVVSFSPTEMDLTSLRRVPEERVCAVLGVPPIIANLGAGLDRSTFSNTDEAGEHFAERKLVPTWRSIEKQLMAQLAPDFGLSPEQSLQFDLKQVRALQEEMSNLWLRVDRSVRSGWITVADARRRVGLEAGPADDVYLRPIVTAAVPAGAEISTITLPPQPQPALTDANSG